MSRPNSTSHRQLKYNQQNRKCSRSVDKKEGRTPSSTSEYSYLTDHCFPLQSLSLSLALSLWNVDLSLDWNKNKLLIKTLLVHQIPCNKRVNSCKPCRVCEKQRNYLVINLITEYWSTWCHSLTPVTLHPPGKFQSVETVNLDGYGHIKQGTFSP